VPAGVKVRLLITAQDVIHSWWVPALAIKKDAIPGFINEAWFSIDKDTTGFYRGQCAELCGRDHGFMPIVLDVRSKDDFDAWLKGQQNAAKPGGATPAPTQASAPAPSAS
jgi:cytochrome c oxidase subunit 2